MYATCALKDHHPIHNYYYTCTPFDPETTILNPSASKIRKGLYMSASTSREVNLRMTDRIELLPIADICRDKSEPGLNQRDSTILTKAESSKVSIAPLLEVEL
jgi:hypothetical protein